MSEVANFSDNLWSQRLADFSQYGNENGIPIKTFSISKIVFIH